MLFIAKDTGTHCLHNGGSLCPAIDVFCTSSKLQMLRVCTRNASPNQPQRLLRLALLYQAALRETSTFPQLSLIHLANLGTRHFSHTFFGIFGCKDELWNCEKEEKCQEGKTVKTSGVVQDVRDQPSSKALQRGSLSHVLLLHAHCGFKQGSFQAGTAHSTNSCPGRKPDVLC